MERLRGTPWIDKKLVHGDTVVFLGTTNQTAFVNFRGENGVVKASVWTFCQPWQKVIRRDADHRKFCSEGSHGFIEILAINRSKCNQR